MASRKYRVIVVGSGMGALSAACLLARDGHQVTVLEQNYLPGGCTSAYYRQGYIFEAGATTVVGLDPGMPLHYLLQELGITLHAEPLDVPMQVHLASGAVLTRYSNLQQWIAEAERVFGPRGQSGFWELCYSISSWVWAGSLRQTTFPPSHWRDVPPLLRSVDAASLRHAPYMLLSTYRMLQYFGLHRNKEFVDFVNEQLLITAQNHCREVNMLFGATALCYTNFGNYYLFGGLIRLVRPLCDYLEQQGADLRFRTKVVRAELAAYGGYTVHTAQGQTLHADRLLWGIPLNNVLECMPHDQQLQRRYRSRQLGGEVLNSAFQLGIGYRQPTSPAVCLHHQIHLPQALPQTGSKSIFLSLSHPLDVARAPRGYGVASVSTHVSQPHQRQHLDKAAATEVVLSELERRQLLPLQHVVYRHSADPAEWERWTARKYGFVGGYPQLMRVKPWQMNDARLDGRGMYLCGDTAYPGQGIPGATLSGIIAHRKMTLDPI